VKVKQRCGDYLDPKATTDRPVNAVHNMSTVGLNEYTGWPQKSKPLPIFQKIVLQIANEIRFLHKVKV